MVRVGAFERLFARFDAALAERGFLAKGGQIVDATIVEARRPRLTQVEKDVVKGGGIPWDWKPARTRQIDRDARWTLKRGKKKPIPPGGSARAAAPEIAVPRSATMYGPPGLQAAILQPTLSATMYSALSRSSSSAAMEIRAVRSS